MPQGEPIRPTFNLLPAETAAVMYIVLIPFSILFLYGLYRRWRVWVSGRHEPLGDLRIRLRRLIVFALGQRKVLMQSYPGLLHTLLYSGIIILFVGTTLVFLDYDIFKALFDIRFLKGNFYLIFEAALDIFGLLAVAGLATALYRRLVTRPKNLPSGWDDAYILAILLLIAVSGFLMEGLRLAITKPPWAQWSPVGYLISAYLTSLRLDGSVGEELYRALWWLHAIASFLGVASLPFTKLSHLFTSPLNSFAAHLRQKGELSKPFDLREVLEGKAFEVKIGVAEAGDFTWRQRLGFDSCTVCGRCSNACPATASGTPLSPMHLILKLRDHVHASFYMRDKRSLHGEVVDPEELWSCVMCGACVWECPVLIDHVDAIADMRRHLVAQGKVERKKQELITNIAYFNNPYGLPQAERAKWAEGLGVKTMAEELEPEFLYWVGCAGSYEPRNQLVSRSMVRIMKAAGVKFAILGNEEICNAEVLRRLGEEGRFQELALRLVEIFKKYRIRKVVVQCPHCFNTFKNEYPKLGAEVEVIHHSQLIAYLLRTGRLRLKRGLGKRVTFHDPCYLGRFNGIYDEPREVLKASGPSAFVEMRRRLHRSFCCGAGGANYWYTVAQKEKINVIRLKEAMEVNPEIVGTACPFCMAMLEDSAKALDVEDRVKVRDIAEVAADLIE